MYFNDKLIYEGHSINMALFCEHLVGKTIESYKLLAVDEEWMDHVVNLPVDFRYVILAGKGE